MRNLKLFALSFLYGRPLAFLMEQLWIHYLKTIAEIREANGDDSPFYLYRDLEDDVWMDWVRTRQAQEEDSIEKTPLTQKRILA